MNSIKLVLVISSIKASIFWSILATRTKMLETKEIPSRKKKDTHSYQHNESPPTPCSLNLMQLQTISSLPLVITPTQLLQVPCSTVANEVLIMYVQKAPPYWMWDFRSSCTENTCAGKVAAQGTGAQLCCLLLAIPSASTFHARLWLQLSGAEVAWHFPGLSPQWIIIDIFGVQT